MFTVGPFGFTGDKDVVGFCPWPTPQTPMFGFCVWFVGAFIPVSPKPSAVQVIAIGGLVWFDPAFPPPPARVLFQGVFESPAKAAPPRVVLLPSLTYPGIPGLLGIPPAKA